QPGETAPTPAAIKVEEGPAPKAVDSPPSLGRASTPPGTMTTEESIPTTRTPSSTKKGDLPAQPVEATAAVVEPKLVKESGPVAGPPAINPQTYAAVAATAPTSTPTTTASAPVAGNLRTAVAAAAQSGPPCPAPPAPSAVESAETTVEAPEAAPVGGAHAVATRPQVAAAPVTPGNAAGLPSGIVSPSNHAVGTGKPPPAPRSTPHAAMVGASGRHSHLPSGDVPSMSGISGATKLGKKASMSKYVPLTPESTAQLTNDTVSG
ncbi:Serine/threonine-protein kinase wnk4, partial [Perkinsus olseni]